MNFYQNRSAIVKYKTKATNWLQRTSGSEERGQRVCLKVIPLHRAALRLDMGKLRKHNHLSSAVSKHGLAAERCARKSSIASCSLLGCGYECRSTLVAGDFLRLKIVA